MVSVRSAPFALGLAAALAPAAALAQIAPGNVLVLRVGDGASTLSNAATAVFLDEFTAAGAFVQTVPLPTINNGAQRAVTCSGTATSEGGLTQSVDGRYFVVAGYGAAVGAASVSSTASSVVPRVCARIALDEVVDSTTALADAYSANNVRCAASYYGAEFWTAGTASSINNPGVRFAASLGASTSTQLNQLVTNIRRVDFWNGQLYCSSASGTFFGVGTVGSGAPTSSSEIITLLPGMPSATGPSPYDFFFADANTLYVADDRTSAAGGIQKWVLNLGTWSLAYVLSPGTGVGCRGLSGFVQSGVATLFATTTSNLLVKVVDGGAGSTVQPLVIGAANTALRGVRFVRTPSSLTYVGTACNTSAGTPAVGTAGGDPLAGNSTFQVTADNLPGGSIVLLSLRVGPATPVGLPIPGAQTCSLAFVLPDVLATTLPDPFGSAAVPMPLPAGASLGGTTISTQAFILDPALVGFALPLGSTDAMQIVVGN